VLVVAQGLPFTTKAKINKMKDMIDADNHFSKLQDKLHRSQPPCIPHIGTSCCSSSPLIDGHQLTLLMMMLTGD
jgi:hypothetical protein